MKIIWNFDSSVNKVFLKHSHVCFLHIVYGCFWAIELSSCDRGHMCYSYCLTLLLSLLKNARIQLELENVSSTIQLIEFHDLNKTIKIINLHVCKQHFYLEVIFTYSGPKTSGKNKGTLCVQLFFFKDGRKIRIFFFF